MSTPITAAQYRSMAESARTGRTFKHNDGSLNVDMLNASRVGASRAVMKIAADRLDDGESAASVAAWVRVQLAEHSLSHEDYFALLVERGQKYAEEYDAKATEQERARRIRVSYLNGSTIAEDETHAVTTTIGAWLDAEGDGRDVDLAILAELEEGETIRVPGGMFRTWSLQDCHVERLPDNAAAERAA